MRICSLTCLSFLLAAQALLGEGRKEATNRRGNKATAGSVHPPQPGAQQRSQSPKALTKGKFVTRDLADCRWAVTEQERGIALKVECTRQDAAFSCVFTGNPTPCLELNKRSAYWKQIVRSLRSQKVLCGDPRSVLKSRVCRKNFPESNLKLANSTLIQNKKPHPKDTEFTSREQSTVKGHGLSSQVGTPTTTTQDPKCKDDPDMVQQKSTALDYCGESWSSLCEFFIAMVQGTSC
ncbi:PREDICTED: fibroblast growth factor-binding protein 1 [Condylura cristata]|uniref:fibroblast growth factor-binding protein 1 n=1 Tax=Condylura cristata TaxID=143302 RepID=UPI000334595F|nr:PREDICTED: fibroblast growth factor-binding protein 1 [Condylura cristata]